MIKMMIRLPVPTALLAILLLFASHTVLSAHRITASSDHQTMAVLELYTSEGCSSCPPAEKYLHQLSDEHGNDKKFIPLAFHVDYWDYIGWEDPFAQSEFSERQKAGAVRNELKSIYTPQFVLHGKDFRAHRNIPKAIDIINEIEPAIDLSVAASLNNSRTLETEVTLNSIHTTDLLHADIRIIITENNLRSHIQDGENAGLKIRHDHVVRHMTEPLKITGSDDDSKQLIMRKINIDPEWKLTDMDLVVFIQNRINGATLQAIKMPLQDLNH